MENLLSTSSIGSIYDGVIFFCLLTLDV